MPATAQDVIDVLRSIDVTLKQLLAAQPKPPPAVADAADLDGTYGDPVIKAKDPKDWTGGSMSGRRFSECPPAYLDLVASRLEYFADIADREGKVTSSGKPVGPFNRRDAARARGWAMRLRSGWTAPILAGFEAAPADAASFASDAAPALSDDEIPF
jgi:hypothetical protein